MINFSFNDELAKRLIRVYHIFMSKNPNKYPKTVYFTKIKIIILYWNFTRICFIKMRHQCILKIVLEASCIKK